MLFRAELNLPGFFDVEDLMIDSKMVVGGWNHTNCKGYITVQMSITSVHLAVLTYRTKCHT